MRFETTLNRSVSLAASGFTVVFLSTFGSCPAPAVDRHRFRAHRPRKFSNSRQLETRRPRQLRDQPDAPGRADLDHRTPAQRFVQHGHRQRAHSRSTTWKCRSWMEAARPLSKLIRQAGIRTLPPAPRSYLRIRRPGVGGGSRQAHHDPSCRWLPAHLRHLLRSPAGRSADDRDGSHSRAIRGRYRSGPDLRL